MNWALPQMAWEATGWRYEPWDDGVSEYCYAALKGL